MSYTSTYRRVCGQVLLAPLKQVLNKEQKRQNAPSYVSHKYLSFDVEPYLVKIREQVLDTLPTYNNAFDTIRHLSTITSDDCDDEVVNFELNTSLARSKKRLNTRLNNVLDQARDLISDDIDDNIWQAIAYLCDRFKNDTEHYAIDSYRFDNNKILFDVEPLASAGEKKLQKLQQTLTDNQIDTKMHDGKLCVYAGLVEAEADQPMLEIVTNNNQLTIRFGTIADYPDTVIRPFEAKSISDLDMLTKAVNLIKPFFN